MELHILASGSSGNALAVKGKEGVVLFDCGIGQKVLAAGLKQVGLSVGDVKGVLLSHEHSDHVQGLPHLCKRFSGPIWATAGTWEALGGVPKQGELMTPGKPFSAFGLNVHPVPTSHDAAEPTGFVVEENSLRVGIVTDTGVVTELLFERLAGCHILLLETNHDLDMLRFGPYPPALKQRIASRQGHLSNEQARRALERWLNPNLRHVVAMHISQENNSPSLVQTELMRVLAGTSVMLSVSPARGPLSVVPREDNHES